MTHRNPQQFVIVNSGSSVSSIFDMRGLRGASIFAPTSAGGNHFFQGGFEVVSASFGRLQLTAANSGDWAVTSPSPAAPWAAKLTQAEDFPYGRLELGAAATDTRTYVLVGKARL